MIGRPSTSKSGRPSPLALTVAALLYYPFVLRTSKPSESTFNCRRPCDRVSSLTSLFLWSLPLDTYWKSRVLRYRCRNSFIQSHLLCHSLAMTAGQRLPLEGRDLFHGRRPRSCFASNTVMRKVHEWRMAFALTSHFRRSFKSTPKVMLRHD